MTRLNVDSLTLPVAEIGPENPLPPLKAFANASGDHPEQGACLPYRLQDGYTRHRETKAVRTVVLENEFLRAEFLLDWGGRLWSLVHKPTGRELLAKNPVLQPANLAIRNAWFSGGVEWNIGIIGHSPFTCSPVFAGRVDGEYPVLRLWEWERLRGVPFQVDFHLPPGSPWLYVRPRIMNPHDHEINMYWWSNIAVLETPETRVLAPADTARGHEYDGLSFTESFEIGTRKDSTYATRHRHSGDMYFQIPKSTRPWEAALDGEGKGLVHVSDERLFGRKMFFWGMGAGGRHWQDFLAEPGFAYIEIQGGLAETQAEYVTMPAREEWTWVEAYGLLEANPSLVHSQEWPKARGHVDARVSETISLEAFSQVRDSDIADKQPIEFFQLGSGWAALENLRRDKADANKLPGRGLVWPKETLGRNHFPWISLLEDGTFPEAEPTEDPGAYMNQPEWLALLEAAVTKPRNDHWLAWLHLGVMRHAAGDLDGAVTAWRNSLDRKPSAWALRNLAAVDTDNSDHVAASEKLLQASKLLPGCLRLAVEAYAALLLAGKFNELLELVEGLPQEVREHGRTRLAVARAYFALGSMAEVGRFFEEPIDLPDNREGEIGLTDLWFGYQARLVSEKEGVANDEALMARVKRECPPPKGFDFRMIDA